MEEPSNGRVFDAWINLPTRPDEFKADPAVAGLFGQREASSAYQSGGTFADVVEQLDALGVQGGVVTKVVRDVAPPFVSSLRLDDDVVRRGCADVREVLDAHPGRFVGSMLLDPALGYDAARHVRIAVEEFGLGAVRIMPALAGVAANEAVCYPLYTAACDLGIPVTVNVGVPGPRKPARLQQPMLLDDVALTFPELKLVLTHVGSPWEHEVVALMRKHPNVYLMTSGWAPKYVDREIFRYAGSSRGRQKVMWASDWPLLPVDRALGEARELELNPESLRAYLGQNAIDVFGDPSR
jgi:predicted TIM-barrel fold metal-dependent hydrolase